MTSFWTKDPTILFNSEYISQLYPLTSMSSEEKLNAITRLVILLTILGYFFTQTLKIVITGIITLAVIVILYNVNKNKPNKLPSSKKSKIIEKFENLNCYNVLKDNYTPPTVKNPVMNVLLTEINDNPNRESAAPCYNKKVNDDIDKKTQKMIENNFGDSTIDKKLFKDLADAYDFDNSMRTFYSTANTKIPNDQEAFAEFCYGDMISCKEGNGFACIKDNYRYTNY
jgi:hypothetical protein